MSDRSEFEKWFLSLNHDFTRDDLYRRKRDGKYFFTKVQALYEQHVKIQELNVKVSERDVLEERLALAELHCQEQAQRLDAYAELDLPEGLEIDK